MSITMHAVPDKETEGVTDTEVFVTKGKEQSFSPSHSHHMNYKKQTCVPDIG